MSEKILYRCNACKRQFRSAQPRMGQPCPFCQTEGGVVQVGTPEVIKVVNKPSQAQTPEEIVVNNMSETEAAVLDGFMSGFESGYGKGYDKGFQNGYELAMAEIARLDAPGDEYEEVGEAE